MMSTIAGLLSADWANALGWTLFHSIWQSLVILLIVMAFMRFIPTKFSGVRYVLTSGGLFFFIGTVLSTFIYLADGPASSTVNAEPNAQIEDTIVRMPMPSTAVEKTLSAISSVINGNMSLILGCWIAGFLFSVARLTNGVYLTCKLRANALLLEEEWSDYVQRAARNLGITRLVGLAESASVSSPIVIGYLKPMIIVPMGMLTGLTTEQLETIFIHELAHIKRHDFLINCIQSLVETIFFFNPFILILSNWIRREREYCCDDLVVAQHGGAKAYAHALTRLAEVRLLTPAFGLPLANGKNHLLNRIRRIMEKSVKNYSAKGRMVIPAVLLVGGLLCVSWLGINPDHRYQSDPAMADQDTINISAFPPIPNIPVIPAVPDIDIQGIPDTIPPPAFPFHSEEQWEEFSRSFGESFRKSMEGLHALRESELFENLKALEERFESKEWPQPFFQDSAAFKNLEQQLERLKGFELEGLEQQLERIQEFELKNLEQQLERLQGPLRDMEKNLRLQETKLRKFEEILREELIQDGYLSRDEAIETMEWNDDSFKVNGKEIKESDKAKYEQLRDKLK